MRDWWKAAFGVVGGLLGAGLILLTVSPPRGQAVVLLPPPTPAPLLVHVTGAVAKQGVFSLPVGSRVRDALAEAGGAQPAADLSAINLAAPLQDGEQVCVPTLIPTRHPPGPDSNPPDPTAAEGMQQPINLNTARAEDLEKLPGIGPTTAEKIVQYRQANGPFPSIESLLEVPGIGQATFDKIKDYIYIP